MPISGCPTHLRLHREATKRIADRRSSSIKQNQLRKPEGASIDVTSYLALGIVFAILAGIMNGTFTLPMRYMGRWSWENVWALFMMVCCVIMPVVIARATVPDFVEVIGQAPHRAVMLACVSGFAWGFGAIMFGQGISAVGISMANTLVLAISASFGSFIPILLLAPERLHQSQGKVIMLGALIGIAGIACCGYAGFLKEKSQKSDTGIARGKMVGHARPFAIGLLLCAGSGLLSAVFNIGYSSAQPLLATAVSATKRSNRRRPRKMLPPRNRRRQQPC